MIIKEGCDSSYMENIDTIFKNSTKCEQCIHNQVCSFKTEQKDLIDKITMHLNNRRPSKIFNFILECEAYQPKSLKPYQPNENKSLKQQY